MRRFVLKFILEHFQLFSYFPAHYTSSNVDSDYRCYFTQSKCSSWSFYDASQHYQSFNDSRTIISYSVSEHCHSKLNACLSCRNDFKIIFFGSTVYSTNSVTREDIRDQVVKNLKICQVCALGMRRVIIMYVLLPSCLRLMIHSDTVWKVHTLHRKLWRQHQSSRLSNDIFVRHDELVLHQQAGQAHSNYS